METSETVVRKRLQRARESLGTCIDRYARTQRGFGG
jgi:hypothetical protein